MSNLSTFYPAPITAADLGLGAASNATFGSIQNTPIGNTTPSTGAFTTLSANNGTLTASAPVLDLEQTWNNAAVAFTGVRFNAVRTAASDSSALLSLTVAGNNRFSVIDTSTGSPRLSFSSSGFSWDIRTRTAGGVGCNFSGIVGFGSRLEFLSSSTSTGAGDVVLLRDSAADTLALQRSTLPQTFRIYNTFTDASNYERGFMRWNTNVLQIGTEKGGTGSARALEFQTDGTTRASVTTGGNFWVNNQLILGTTVLTRITSPADGVVTLFDSGQAAFNRLQFGGTTSSFPALKRSSTALQVRLADDSGYAPLESSTLALNNGTITSSTPCLTAIQTWNNAAENFHLCTLGITNATPWTASAASSTLFRCQLAGSTVFSVGYTGGVSSGGTISSVSGYTTNGTFQMSSNVTMSAGTGQTWDVWTSSALKLRLWNLGSPSSATNFERANLRWDGNEFIIDVSNGGTGTLRGIKIGSATSSLLGFYGVTPVDQPATVADPAGGGTIDTEARTAINAIIDRLQELGLIA